MTTPTAMTPSDTPAILQVRAGVRYWEDAEVNGAEDTKGDLIPVRDGRFWAPFIDIKTGKIIDWPQGTTASIHYKVCDDGQYWLTTAAGRELLKWSGDYVPDQWLCWGDRGYGDYIIMTVESDGRIEGWSTPEINTEDWEAVR